MQKGCSWKPDSCCCCLWHYYCLFWLGSFKLNWTFEQSRVQLKGYHKKVHNEVISQKIKKKFFFYIYILAIQVGLWNWFTRVKKGGNLIKNRLPLPPSLILAEPYSLCIVFGSLPSGKCRQCCQFLCTQRKYCNLFGPKMLS